MKLLEENAKNLKYKHVLLVFLVIYLMALVFTVNLKYLIWDETCYVLNSLSYSGFPTTYDETSFRPPLIPLFISALSYVFGNIEVIGKLLTIAMSIGSIIFLYKISEELFNEKVALFSSLLFALFPMYFFYSKMILVDVPAIFLSLVSIYFFLKSKDNLSGIFLSLSFLAKYHVGLLTGAALLIMFLLNKFHFRESNYMIKNIQAFKLFLFALLTLSPWLVYNQIRLGFFARPFLMQVMIFSDEVPVSFNYYFENFFGYFPLPYLVFIPGILFLSKKTDIKSVFCIVWFFLFVIFVSMLSWKELRFLIYAVPASSIILGSALFTIGEKFKKISIILFAICVLSAISYDVVKYYQYEYVPGYGNEKFDYEATINMSKYIHDNIFENQSVSTNSMWPVISYYSSRKIIVARTMEDVENSSYFLYYNTNFLNGSISYIRENYDLVKASTQGKKEISLFRKKR